MPRCYCCDAPLSDYEATIKSETTGEYLDTCLKCLSYIPEINLVVREDLCGYEEIPKEDDGEPNEL